MKQNKQTNVLAAGRKYSFNKISKQISGFLYLYGLLDVSSICVRKVKSSILSNL